MNIAGDWDLKQQMKQTNNNAVFMHLTFQNIEKLSLNKTSLL